MDEQYKAITSIPGWSELLNEELRKQPSDGVALYKNSVWANRCVSLKANALAGVPWCFFDSKDEEIEKDNLSRVLLEGSEEENLNDILRGTGADLDIYGHAFWEKQGTESTLTGINRINAGTVRKVVVTEAGKITGFEQEVNGGKRTLKREEVVYFHTYTPDHDLKGLSLLEVGREAIVTEIAANKYLAAFFANGAVPAAVMTTEQMLSDQDLSRLKRWWNRTFRGTGNQHKVAWADRGLKLNKLGLNLEELALKEVREESRRDVCAVLGVPPALAGAWEAANYAASAQQRQSFYTETIIPRAEYMAGVINAELIQPINANIKFGWKYMDLDVMQPDMVAERNSIGNLVRAGVITPLAAALQLGYEEDEAGIGPVMTSIIDEEADVVPGKTMIQEDLERWQRKAENRIAKGKAAQVTFESDIIPPLAMEVIFDKLADAANKAQISEIFKGFIQ